MTVVALGLGSSMGDRRRMLRLAVHALDAAPGITLERCSRIVATAPAGGAASGMFLNAAVRARTTLAPAELMRVCRAIEARLGRRPTRRWGDRVIDIDLLLYGERIVAEGSLRVPHPRLVERDFVLIPLLEVWPDAPNPWTHLRYRDTIAPRASLPVVGALPQPMLRAPAGRCRPCCDDREPP